MLDIRSARIKECYIEPYQALDSSGAKLGTDYVGLGRSERNAQRKFKPWFAFTKSIFVLWGYLVTLLRNFPTNGPITADKGESRLPLKGNIENVGSFNHRRG